MTHPVRSLLALVSFVPLAACFEPVEPELSPAEIESGAWHLVLANVEMSADCGWMEDEGETLEAVAFIDADEDEISIWLEGMFLDGDIEGNRFETSGSLGGHSAGGDRSDYGASSDPEEDCIEVEPAGDDSGEAPPCAEPPEEETPYPNPDFAVELDGIIVSPDVIHGEMRVAFSDGFGTCRFSADMVGIALDMGDGEPEPAVVVVEKEEEDVPMDQPE